MAMQFSHARVSNQSYVDSSLQREALEAAKLYEDFVESFAEDPAEKGPKAFVRGEVIQPGQRPSD